MTDDAIYKSRNEVGYTTYFQEQQLILRKKNPNMTLEEMEKNLDKRWSTLSVQEQKPYVDATHKTVRTVFVALLVDLFAFTLILPLFPRLLNYYRHNNQQVKKTTN